MKTKLEIIDNVIVDNNSVDGEDNSRFIDNEIVKDTVIKLQRLFKSPDMGIQLIH